MSDGIGPGAPASRARRAKTPMTFGNTTLARGPLPRTRAILIRQRRRALAARRSTGTCRAQGPRATRGQLRASRRHRFSRYIAVWSVATEGGMDTTADRARRRFLKDAVGVGAAVALATRGFRAGAKEEKKEEAEENVSPTEDLMREHGVLRRILLVYGEVVRRVDAKEGIKPDPVAHAAKIIRAFIEDYHERDEEEYIFPRFQTGGKMTELVSVLVLQHQAGRKLTANIERLATASALTSDANRHEMADSMRQFIRMYEPHSAREDTVLFPAFARLISEKELHKLMDTFEQKEKALPLGDFEKMVADVTNIERAFGIYDLAQFTKP
jgi:hemerythrin-like domain-containing protein